MLTTRPSTPLGHDNANIELRMDGLPYAELDKAAFSPLYPALSGKQPSLSLILPLHLAAQASTGHTIVITKSIEFNKLITERR